MKVISTMRARCGNSAFTGMMEYITRTMERCWRGASARARTSSGAAAVEAATATATAPETTSFNAGHQHAYATMMYMGTPRDYEFYVATRVMLRSLLKLGVEADLVVIASLDVPPNWVKTL